jgi:hypothetical protein
LAISSDEIAGVPLIVVVSIFMVLVRLGQ